MNYIDYNENDIQSFEYETTIISDSNIIGTCELGKAEIQMLNDSNEYSSLKGSWIKTVHGSFYIYDVNPVQEKVNIKLSCYDIKYKLDTTYNSFLYNFPMTLKSWRNAIFTNCGVAYDDSDFPNSDLILEKQPYIDSNASNRTVIKMIAQAGASAVITDENDIFYFSWFEDVIHEVNDWTELTTEKDSTKAINVVVLGRGETEDNVYYPEVLPEEPIEFRIDNNYILDPQDTTTEEDIRYTTIVPIYNQVNGFSYLVFNMKTQNIDNKLSLKLGQKVKYLDIYDNELEAYVMTKKIVYLGGNLTDDENYEITISAESIKETSTDYSYSSSVADKVYTVERKTDKLEGKIEDTIKIVEEDSEKVAKMEMTVDEMNTDINHKYNFLESDEGTNQLDFDNSLEYQPVSFNVQGNTEKILYVYPSDNLYPSNNLYPRGLVEGSCE